MSSAELHIHVSCIILCSNFVDIEIALNLSYEYHTLDKINANCFFFSPSYKNKGIRGRYHVLEKDELLSLSPELRTGGDG
jgi:hypothetical protein